MRPSKLPQAPGSRGPALRWLTRTKRGVAVRWLAELDLDHICHLVGWHVPVGRTICVLGERRIYESETNPSAGTLMHEYLGYRSTRVPESLRGGAPSGVERGLRLTLGHSASVPVKESGVCSLQ